MRFEPHAADGFTLVEVVVAIVVLTIGVLALASGAAATVRSMADAERIAGTARAAESERERASATTCVANAGVDSVHGAWIVWKAAPAATVLYISQTIALPRAATIDITAAESCR